MTEIEQLKMQLEFAHESTKRVTAIYTDEINRVLDERDALKDALVQAGITEKRLKEHADRVNNANDQLIVEILPLYEDKARLDWLLTSEGGSWLYWAVENGDWSPERSASRDAIDFARKEAQP